MSPQAYSDGCEDSVLPILPAVDSLAYLVLLNREMSLRNPGFIVLVSTSSRFPYLACFARSQMECKGSAQIVS